MSNPFTFQLDRAIREAQVERTGNQPRDLVEPYNYPYKLRRLWRIFAVEANLWRVRLNAPQTLAGAGTDVDTSVAEGEFLFHHIVRDFHLYQYDSSGGRVDDALTWEFGRSLAGDYYPIRAGSAQPEVKVSVEDLLYRSNGENYRVRLEGSATNVVEVELWVEVLRI